MEKGQEIEVKVVDQESVADILQFSRLSNQTLEMLLNRLEFFKIETSIRQSTYSESPVEQYDFSKLILFCILYCEEENYERKVEYLFYLMCDD